MININSGHNTELMKACRVLEEYSILIEKIREYRCTMEIHDAIIKAVDDCVETGILVETLTKYREEILMNIINDFTEEEFHEMLRREAL